MVYGKDVTYSFQDLILMVTEHHEQVDLPAGAAVHRVYLQRDTHTHHGTPVASTVDSSG
jgi:hypothetical protein